jgi:hypothetical protein
MRDKSHTEEIERWASFVRENPGKWKAKVKPFLDSQILISRRFYKKLLETEEGRKKFKELRGISS